MARWRAAAVVMASWWLVVCPPPARAQAPFVLSSDEVETLGRIADVERMMVRRAQVARDERLQGYLADVGLPLVPPTFRDPRLHIRFALFRDAQPNAFALPNGSIYVSLGLLAQLENEAQLAAVLAHEIAHVTHYHYFTFDRQARSTSTLLNVLTVGSAVLGGWGALAAQVGIGTLAVGTLYGYSRDLEEEADREALAAVARAGYDPAQIPALFGRLLVDYDGTHVETPIFYSDHPKLQSRIEYTTRLMRERGLAPDAGATGAAPYAATRRRAAAVAVRLAIRDGLPRTAIAWAGEMVRQDPQSAEAHYLKAEAYRALGHRPADLVTSPPSAAEKKRQAELRQRRTPEEIEAADAATPAGLAAWAANSEMAMAEYRTAVGCDPKFAATYAGLAQLEAALGHFDAAVQAAGTFLDLAAPDDLERARIRQLRETWMAATARPPSAEVVPPVAGRRP
ncbi:MAG: M48 family metalloprotease [Vicinamibacterales bacterium]